MSEPNKGMDILHRPDDFQFISDEINVREFYEAAIKALNSDAYCSDLTEHEDLARQMDCSPLVAGELSNVCSVEQLKCGLEEEDDPLAAPIPSESTLMTSEIQRRELEKRAVLSYRQMQVQLQKYRRFNFKILENYKEAAERRGIEAGRVPSDVLFTVYFAKPYNKPLERHEIRLGRLLSLDFVFYVRGSQKLTALRDKINCLSDWGVLHDYSEDPDQPQETLTKDVYKSGYFYINGTFYNDMRDPAAVDLSQDVMSWAWRRPREIGKMTKADMNETTFMDLTLRLGQPYLYLHQGTCEHLMIFTDMRLIHPTDCQSIDEYPVQVTFRTKKRAACCICKVYTARWVTFENENLPFDPGFFCDSCFRSFNYNEKGEKVCNFRAIPYFDRSLI